ncbi:MAG: alpha/beta hydrolase [Rhodocyclaceae bacterium]|nr:alpha/beta hydrolase [Rhodocyclaceae bacterium]
MDSLWQESWSDYETRVATVEAAFAGRYQARRFDYRHPLRLQDKVPKRLRRVYPVSVAYTDWGPAEAPVVLCVGGVANCAHRFHFLASGLTRPGRDCRVICVDWVGRGRSGWLADQSEYCLDTYVEQLRQVLNHLGLKGVTLLGSSLGGTAAIELAARHPHLVGGLILNDTGPFIPAGRRKRRAETLARHYVFRSPEEIARRVGVSQRNDGPIGEEVRLYNTYHQTRWSDEEGGRIYRHDPRALMAYREDAHHNVNVWASWWRLRQRVLVTHGMESDALLVPTLHRMQQRRGVTVAHIPRTGHTPVLDDANHIHFIRAWLAGELEQGTAFTALHADSYP